MSTPNLQEVLTFVEVARKGSLSEAASALEINIGTVSRRIDRLEERLGVRLLDRNTRGLTLTEAGHQYAKVAGRGLDLIVNAEVDLQEIFDEPRGLLRVAAPSIFVRHILGKLAVEYAKRYPHVELHVFEADKGVDMDKEDIHISIQVLPPSKWELQGVRSSRTLTRKSLGQLQIILCASPDYIQSHPAIEHPRDLENHQCIIQGANPSARFVRFFHSDGSEHVVEAPMSIFTTSVAFCKRAVLAGLGPAGLTLPDCQHLLDQGSLIRLLPDWNLESLRCVVAFVDGPNPPQRIRAFLDLCDQYFVWLKV